MTRERFPYNEPWLDPEEEIAGPRIAPGKRTLAMRIGNPGLETTRGVQPGKAALTDRTRQPSAPAVPYMRSADSERGGADQFDAVRWAGSAAQGDPETSETERIDLARRTAEAERVIFGAGEPRKDTPEQVFARATSGTPADLPGREAQERYFGRDFGNVKVFTGVQELRDKAGAQAAAQGDRIAFASETPGPALVAHELVHVEQQRRHGESALAASKTVSDLSDASEREAEQVAEQVATHGLTGPPPTITAAPSATLHLDRTQDAEHRARRLDQNLAGMGVKDLSRAQISTWSEFQRVDGDAERIDYEYTFAVTGDVESGSGWLLVARRSMHITLRAGTRFATEVQVEATGRARFDGVSRSRGEMLPSDGQAAVNWPARVATLGATVRVLDAKNPQHFAMNGKAHSPGQSLAHTVAGDRLLAFQSTPEQRIAAARDLLQRMEVRDRNERWLQENEPAVRQALADLDAYIAAMEAQQDNHLDPQPAPRIAIEQARETLRQFIETMPSIKDPSVRAQAEELARMLRSRLARAQRMKVPEPAVGSGVLLGFREFAYMILDIWGAYAQKTGEVTGAWDLDVEPKSGIGKMRAEGKSWSEITVEMVDATIDQIDHALTEAGNGNFAPLADLGIELAVDAMIPGAAGGGVAKGGRAAAKTGARAGRAAGKSAMQIARERIAGIRARAQQLSTKLSKDAPRWVKDEAHALFKGATDALESPAARAAGIDSDIGVRGLFEEFGRAHQRARLESAIDRAKDSLAAQGLGGRGNAVFQNIDQLAHKHGLPASAGRALVDAVNMIADRGGDVTGVISAMERTFPVAGRFEPDAFARMLRQATTAANPVEYLESVRWLANLGPEARKSIATAAGAGHVDLSWLRSADLSPEQFEVLAGDPTTRWSRMQRAAEMAADLPPEVQSIIGKHIDDIKAPPPGTEIISKPRGGKTIQWVRGQRKGRPRLMLDDFGRVTVDPGNQLNRDLLAGNMRKVGTELVDHQDHHIVPIELARDHELFKGARMRGEPRWDPNAQPNGIQLPSTAEAREAAAESKGLPLHSGSHGKYTEMVEKAADERLQALIARYGGVDQIPPEALTRAAHAVEDDVRRRLHEGSVPIGADGVLE